MDNIDNLIKESTNNLLENEPNAIRKDPYNKYVSRYGKVQPSYREFIDYNYLGRIKDFFSEFFWRSVMGDYTYARNLGIKLSMLWTGLTGVDEVFKGFSIKELIFGEGKIDKNKSDKVLDNLDGMTHSKSAIKTKFNSNQGYSKIVLQDIFVKTISHDTKDLSPDYKSDKMHKDIVNSVVKELDHYKNKKDKIEALMKMFF